MARLRLNPKGIQSLSPGLRASATLGSDWFRLSNPERVASPREDAPTTAMPQSLARILVHAVFSTKERRPFLQKVALRSEVHCYLGGILKNQGQVPHDERYVWD